MAHAKKDKSINKFICCCKVKKMFQRRPDKKLLSFENLPRGESVENNNKYQYYSGKDESQTYDNLLDIISRESEKLLNEKQFKRKDDPSFRIS